jgi:hypothetical protein
LATGRFALFYRQLLSNIILAVITLTLAPFLFLLSLFANTPVNSPPPPPPTPVLPPWENNGDLFIDLTDTGALEEYIPPDLRVVYYIALAAAGLVVFLLLMRAQTAIRRRWSEETGDVLYEPGNLLKELRDAFAARAKRAGEAAGDQAVLRRDQQVEAAARIRQIYTELIRLAADFGLPRDPAQTPLEFTESLQADWSSAGPDLDRITQAYLKIRYGGFPESAGEVRTVEEAWKSVRSSGLVRVRDHEQKLREADRERRRREQVA